MPIAYPPAKSLALTPTPLVAMPRTSDYLGVEFLCKRDDLTGFELSGNKVRKLEFLLADAIEKGADTVMTCGGEQSNHCRATALAATRLGLRCVLLLRIPDKGNPPSTEGNILLDKLAGAEIVWIDHDEWRDIDDTFARETKRLREQGRKPYAIPTGGSNALGSWGYVRCAEELSLQLADHSGQPTSTTTIVYACGSGGTGAGLALGAKYFDFADRNISIVGFNVSDTAEYFIDTMMAITSDFSQRFRGTPTIARDELTVIDGYVGDGYAKSRPNELAEIRDMARREAVILDPVYSGKAFFGLVSELKKSPTRFGRRVVFVHTGGAFGLFGKTREMTPLL